MRIDNSHLAKQTPHPSLLAQPAPPAVTRPSPDTASPDSRVSLSPQLAGKVAELRARLHSLDAAEGGADLEAVREKLDRGHYHSVETARQTAEAVVARWFRAVK